MTEYHSNKTGRTLRLSSDMIGANKNNFLYNLLQIHKAQVFARPLQIVHQRI